MNSNYIKAIIFYWKSVISEILMVFSKFFLFVWLKVIRSNLVEKKT